MSKVASLNPIAVMGAGAVGCYYGGMLARAGRDVVPAVVYVAVEMAGPGHVRHHGRSELLIGRSPASARIAAAFGAAGVPVEVSDNVIGALWAKLVVNCAYNALSAITQLPYGRMVQGDGVPAVMRSEEHTSELQSPCNLVCRLLLEKKKSEDHDV